MHLYGPSSISPQTHLLLVNKGYRTFITLSRLSNQSTGSGSSNDIHSHYYLDRHNSNPLSTPLSVMEKVNQDGHKSFPMSSSFRHHCRQFNQPLVVMVNRS
jgi:hypothetical protein